MAVLTQRECYEKYWGCDDHACPFYEWCDSGKITNMTMQDFQLLQMEEARSK